MDCPIKLDDLSSAVRLEDCHRPTPKFTHMQLLSPDWNWTSSCRHVSKARPRHSTASIFAQVHSSAFQPRVFLDKSKLLNLESTIGSSSYGVVDMTSVGLVLSAGDGKDERWCQVSVGLCSPIHYTRVRLNPTSSKLRCQRCLTFVGQASDVASCHVVQSC